MITDLLSIPDVIPHHSNVIQSIFYHLLPLSASDVEVYLLCFMSSYVHYQLQFKRILSSRGTVCHSMMY